MPSWNDRQLPHPLLAPWSDDYGDRTFAAKVPHAVEGNGERISFTIKYHLTSESLRELILKRKAHYLAIVSCPGTRQRSSLPTVAGDEDVHVLKASEYASELLVSPYVVASTHLTSFMSDEHAEEFRQFRPEGFDVARASILAVGADTRINLDESGSPESVIDLVSNRRQEDGLFTVELDEPRIKIQVSPKDKQRIEALRGRGDSSTDRASLFPSVYLHAVTEALRRLSEYPDETSWVKSMVRTLEREDIAVDKEDLKDRALFYAQKLMNRPIGRMLAAFENREDEE